MKDLENLEVYEDIGKKLRIKKIKDFIMQKKSKR